MLQRNFSASMHSAHHHQLTCENLLFLRATGRKMESKADRTGKGPMKDADLDDHKSEN